MTATPWSRADALKTAVLVAVGSVVWAVGWYGVSGKPALEDQIAPFNVVVVGFVVIGAGYVSWFLAGRRAVGARRRSLIRFAADLRDRVGTAAPASGPDGYVGTERLFHRPGCAMAADRAWSPMARAEHERAGRVPCGVCAP